MKSKILLNYLRIYSYIAQERIDKKDLPERYMHAHLVSVLSTGLLMWAYAILALFTMSSRVPGIVGVIASFIHLLSPLLYRFSNNYILFSNLFIATGLIHQGTFAFYTGGFDSNILIWLGILPMISGVIVGGKNAILWALITAITILIFLILKLTGYHFPIAISALGQVISQGLILFGWVFLSTVIIWVYDLLIEQSSNKLKTSRKRTQNLINILSHDISNPLTIIVLKLKFLTKSSLNDMQLKLVSEAYRATERVIKITENIKELRLTELRKKQITYDVIDLKDLVLELKENDTEMLEQKNIHFNWFISDEISSFISSRGVLNQILSNLFSNAIKYSSRGGEIRLNISKCERGVQFVMKDSGVGIPIDMRENVFEASLSRSCPGTEGETGTGFGLPIVRACVEMLNGTISFVSNTSLEGPSGTSFILTFPDQK